MLFFDSRNRVSADKTIKNQNKSRTNGKPTWSELFAVCHLSVHDARMLTINLLLAANTGICIDASLITMPVSTAEMLPLFESRQEHHDEVRVHLFIKAREPPLLSSFICISNISTIPRITHLLLVWVIEAFCCFSLNITEYNCFYSFFLSFPLLWLQTLLLIKSLTCWSTKVTPSTFSFCFFPPSFKFNFGSMFWQMGELCGHKSRNYEKQIHREITSDFHNDPCV